MKMKNPDLEKLERTLFGAGRKGGAQHLGSERWQSDLMREIRRGTKAVREADLFGAVGRLAWAAAVPVLLCAVLGGSVLLRSGAVSRYVAAQLEEQETATSLLADYFG